MIDGEAVLFTEPGLPGARGMASSTTPGLCSDGQDVRKLPLLPPRPRGMIDPGRAGVAMTLLSIITARIRVIRALARLDGKTRAANVAPFSVAFPVYSVTFPSEIDTELRKNICHAIR